ncbi:non-ribosomal peptide synthase/polyketide synthase [Nocardia sp. CC201C]|uniref:non-ribosomal peptide synthase/polyketide synthase n=1 Tax=Nocardia sp. CC201C TaxID=3044575 RepID=UPI0024A9D2A5|nr:non-ribosomal peptide synthase/polyketide synthase [Nocardia sp. CC201C]
MQGTELDGVGVARRAEPVVTDPVPFPLAPAQLGVWYAQLLDPEVPINVAQYVDVAGELDPALLNQVLVGAAREFGSALVRFVEIDGQPQQVVDPSLSVEHQIVDLRAAADPIAAAHEWMRADATAPVDLLTDRLFAGAVLRVADRRWFWYMRAHHIVLDGFGALTNTMRVAERYTARVRGTEPGPARPGTLESLVAGELSYRDSDRFATDRAYWSERIRGLEPTTLSRRVAAPAAGNLRYGRALPPRLTEAMNSLAANHDSSAAVVLLAAFAAYLARLTDRSEAVLSMPVTARTTAVMRRSAGMLSNIVPLRLPLDADATWAQLLHTTRLEVSGALRHQRYRLEDMHRDTDRDGGPGGRTLYGPLANIMLFPADLTLGAAPGRYHVLTSGPVEDLSMQVYYGDSDRVHLELEANPNLYTHDEIARHHGRFVAFLERLLGADPRTPLGAVPVTTELERAVSLRTWNDTGRPVGRDATLVSLFAAQVRRTPDAVALRCPDAPECELSYGELDARVNRLARHLISLGVGPESLVGLHLRRSPELVIAMYAIQAAGGAYVPLDPDHPAERLGHILDTARPVCVLTRTADRPTALDAPVISVDTLELDGYPSAPLTDAERLAPLRPANTAYVIFTSGSTGRPKGVAVSHRSIVNRLLWMQTGYVALTDSDRVLQKTPFTFDVSVPEFFWPLQVGARLVLARPDGHTDPDYIVDLIRREGITSAHFVPSMLTAFVTALETTDAHAASGGRNAVRTLRHVWCSGEALPVSPALRVAALTGARVHNLYGPTEAAVEVTCHEVTGGDAEFAPIGAPVFNTRLYVLDSRLRPVPVGVPGELYLSGVQLARGYVARPGLTAERFVADPFAAPGELMYRTGDLVCWNTRGEVEYLGRTDFQVKLRGLRIELGEIETVLAAVERVAHAVVLVRDDQLVAYVVPSAPGAVSEERLRAAAARALPAYMVPTSYLLLDDLPLNSSGKLDRKALPAPRRTAAAYTAPASPVEATVARVLGEVLGHERVGRDDDFFALGGNSLVATRVSARLAAELGCRIGLRELFSATTVAALAAVIEQHFVDADAEVGASVPVPRARPEVLPLSPAQQRIWFLNRLDSTGADYNMPFVVRLRGDADIAALRAAVADVVARHEVLRTIFPRTDDGACQRVLSADAVSPFVDPRWPGGMDCGLFGGGAPLADYARPTPAEPLGHVPADQTPAAAPLVPGTVEVPGAADSVTAADDLVPGVGDPVAGVVDPVRDVGDNPVAGGADSATSPVDQVARVVAPVAGAAGSATAVVDSVAGAADSATDVVAPVAGARAAAGGAMGADVEPISAAELDAELRRFAADGFDLEHEIPFRARLFLIAERELALAVVLHHIAADGLSLPVLARDVATAYAARRAGHAPGWAPLPLQYADYTLWQRERLGDPADEHSLAARQLRFWTETLADAPEQLDLPSDRPRPAVASGAGATYLLEVPTGLHVRLAETAQEHGVSTFMLLHAALAVLLARLSGGDDIVIGTPVGGRGERELDELIGMFVNTLPLRTPVDGRIPFSALLDRVREVDLAAFAHADVPFEQLVEVLNPARSRARHPLFQVMLSWTGAGGIGVELPGLLATAGTLDTGVTKFDLSIAVTESFAGAGPGEGPAPAGIQAEFTFATDLFDSATIAEYARYWLRLLDTITRTPGTPVADLPLLDADEVRELLQLGAVAAEFAPTAVPPVRADTVISAFERQARLSPTAVALIDGPWVLTYAEMSAQVNRLARLLVSLGVGPDTLVVLGMRRSAEFVLAAYAVLTAGGAYVPVDPDQPAARVRRVVETARPICVLTTSDDGWEAETDVAVVTVDTAGLSTFAADPVTDLDRRAPLRAANLAYVIFTSGSTGTPKGVAVQHASVVNQIAWITSEYAVVPTDVVLFKTPATFDVSVWELFAPLVRGATLVVAAHDGHRDTAYLAETIALYGVTMTSFVPAMLAVFARSVSPADIASLRTVLVAGEAFDGETAAAFARVSAAALHNLYGPTEFTVHATHAPVVPAESGPVPIGRAVSGGHVYVLDARLRPVPARVAGELYLSGVQVARGYHGRADLTADRFVPNPFGPSGSRMYRTGDLVRWTRAGVLEYLGRGDFQVKLRGQRIELGEIEAALLAAPEVRAAAVTVHRHAAGELLAAYVVTELAEAEAAEVLSERLRATLPSYMVPTAYTRLSELPLTASGKLDRKALPEPEVRAAAYRAPVTPAQRAVAEIFAEVLGARRVGLDDDFFALGGNSLVATRISARLAEALHTEVPVRLLFEHTTVARLADSIAPGAVRPRPPLVARERPETVPLSYAQQRIWFANRFDSASVADNLVAALRLAGALDPDALAAAVTDVVARHETLRTVYPAVHGIGRQRVLPVAAAVGLATVDIDAADLDDRIRALAVEPFAVAERVPLRLTLLRLGERDHVLVIAVHHIAADGWSIAPLTRDLLAAYVARRAAATPEWTPLPVQYADYTLWQRELLGAADDPESVLAAQLRFWRVELDGLPEVLALPTDRPRPAVPSGRGAAHRFTVSADLRDRLRRLAESQRASLFMVVHAAFAALLATLSGQRDIPIGTPVAGRGDRALDDLVGMFVNTLVLRTEVHPERSFADLLAAVRDADLRAFAHADLPFERLVEELAPARVANRHPLFQVALTFQNHSLPAGAVADLRVAALPVTTGTARFDLQLTVAEPDADGLDVEITYATDLFDAATVDMLAGRFELMLETVAAYPALPIADIRLLGEGERHCLLYRWSTTAPGVATTATLADRFAAAAAIDPEAVAVRADGSAVSYAELEVRSNRLARRLIAAGVGPEALVAVALPRTVELVVALLAVVKAGGGYLPIDPNYPADRIEYVVDDARPVCALTSGGADLPAGWFGGPVIDLDTVDLDGYSASPVTDRDRRAALDPAHPAYVIYTSGSTGRPKGVLVPHRNVVRLFDNTEGDYGFGPSDVWVMFHSYAFDFSVWELWGALLYGGSIVLVDYFTSRSPRQFRQLLAAERVTVLNQTPSAFYQLIAAEAEADDGEADDELSLRYVIFGGEALEPQRLRDWFVRHPQSPVLVNMYGITETTVHASYRLITPETGAASVIGGALPGLALRVLDARLRPVPIGVPGEIYVSGGQVARGYLGRPALTAARFVADPYGEPGALAYRSGDLARWTAAGELEYLGRADQQVNLRGFRIELGEIEAALLAEPGVREAAVVVRRDEGVDEARIVGYVVVDDAVDPARLRETAARRLPEYMVPAAVVAVERIPLTVNGKLDRAALPAPVFETTGYRRPTGVAEEIVAGVFAELLGLERVGAADDFFALGGSSLLAAQAVARIGAALDADLAVRAVFEHPGVADLAAYAEANSGVGERIPLESRPRPDRLPLSYAQQRMWFRNRFDAASAADNIPLVIRLTGALDVESLATALGDVIERHEALRTVYPDGPDGPQQRILPAAPCALPALTVPEADIVTVPEADIVTVREADIVTVPEADIAARITEFVSAGFDLTREAPVRAALLRLDTASETHVLALVLHHISADGFSLGPLAADLMTAYAARRSGAAPAWLPLPVQYADYTLWQTESLGSTADPESVLSRQLAYWRTRLAGLPEHLDLPTDRPRPAVATERGGTHRSYIDSHLHSGVAELARKHDATLFSTVHAALAVLLARLSGTADIAIGTPVAGRGERALDGLVGMFVNTLVLRTEVDPRSSFDALLGRVRETDIAALSHADVPFERLVEELAPARARNRHPLFQVALTFQNFALPTLELPGLTVRAEDADTGTAKFDLQFTVTEQLDADGRAGGMTVEITYARDLFDADSIAVLARRFEQVLAAVAADRTVVVGDIQLLSAEEQRRALHEWSCTGADIAAGDTIADRFARAAAIDPAAVAVRAGAERLTFAELEVRSNRLARRLIAAGVGPEALVAVALPRTVELVVALLAVVKAGGGYLPIDPNYPADRIEYVVDDARPVCALTSGGADLPAGWFGGPVIDLDTVDLDGYADTPVIDADRRAPLDPANAAYVIYTSGSTGRPKGVVIPHANVIRLLDNTHRHYGFGPSDVWVMFHSYAFDFSVWELWGALLYGGSIVLVDYFTSRSPRQFRQLLAAERVTVLNQTPTAFYQLIAADAEADDDLALRYVIFGGEALEPQRLREWFVRHPQSPVLVNMYGITETTVHASYRPIPVDTGSASVIGSALPGLAMRLLDARLLPVPVGVPGEIYVSGGQLARGYLNRFGLTAARFVADPYGEPGALAYRSGDLARWTAAGDIEYLGRADQQVNLRGFRIELGEIEAALLAEPGVREAAVVVRRDEGVDEARIVGYVVPAGEGEPEVPALRQAVARRLPEHMIPAALVAVERIPLTVNGKLDKAALPAPVFESRTYRKPATFAEEIVAGVFADLMGVDQVGADDDFFALGGSSLLAAKAVARIGGILDATVGVRMLFEFPRVAELAARIGTDAASAPRPVLGAGVRPERLPLSPAQQRMWFLNRFDRTSTAYNIPLALRLSGELDVEALAAALGDVIERHESLRTVYPETADGAAQLILPTDRVVPSLAVETVTEAELPRRIREVADTAFDVTADVPVRVRLFRVVAPDCVAADRVATDHVAPDRVAADRVATDHVAPDCVAADCVAADRVAADHVFAGVLHHIAADGSSLVPFVRDLMVAYAARLDRRAPAWTPLTIQYADYALWQHALLGSERDTGSLAARQLAYWQETLAGLPDQLDLPADHPRPARQSLRGKRIHRTVDADLHARLIAVGRERGATLFMVVHAAFAALLARLSGGSDIAVGTPIAGRGDSALDDVIGMFVNTLVLRTGIDPAAPFTELLTRVRAADIAAFSHADVPFERLVEVLNPERSTARHPLFQVGLSFQNHERAALRLPGLTVSEIEFDNDIAQFDLHLFAVDDYDEAGKPAGMAMTLGYATDLFTADTARRMVDALIRMLAAIAAAPDTAVGDIDLLGPELRQRMLRDWNDTAHPVPATTLAALVDGQVARTPGAVALLDADGSSLDYAAFDARVNRLARHLIARGVAPERTVALAMRRGIDLVVAMYAVVKAGGAYVPIDPDHPGDRIAHIIDTAAPVCVLTTAADGLPFGTDIPVHEVDTLDLTALSPAPIRDDERVRPLRAHNPAYVIFTSGSTGKPKGVTVSHAAIANQLHWLGLTFDLGPGDRALLKTPATFDLSVWEFWSPLVTGGSLVVTAPGDERDPDRLRALIERHGVTVLHPVPSLLAMLLAGGPLPAPVRAVLTIGETLPAATAAEFLAKSGGARLFNLYGPTEAAVSVTAHEVREATAQRVPIGGPAWNSRGYVLDGRLRPVPVGVPGELYLAGDQLARGYHGWPARTADRFVADPFSGGRMYRTGDIVRWRADGELEYLDRADFQVKIGGHRIELGEVETVLRRCDGVSAAVAVARPAGAGQRLIAYAAVPQSNPERREEIAGALRTALVGALPGYMVPAAVVVLDGLPLNANGKVDRAALPDPVLPEATHRDPATVSEKLVAAAFAEVIETDARIGADTDFFALGGNSLMATRLAARLGEDLGVRVPVAAVFETPTVGGLAERLTTAEPGAARPLPTRRVGTDPAPLSLAQQRMWVLNRLQPNAAAYNVPVAIRLTGTLDGRALTAAVRDVLGRHEILRTRYPEIDGVPVQEVLAVADVEIDLTPIPLPHNELDARLAEFVGAGFDVTAAAPVRARLWRTAPTEHVLVVVLHHISADGYSVAPMTRDLVLAYTARLDDAAPAWEPLAIQYGDFSAWQRELLGSDTDPDSLLSRQLAYWTAELAGVPEQLPLPTDRPRPARREMRGDALEVEAGTDLTARLALVARDHGTTLFGVVHTAFVVLLSKLSGVRDIAIGAPVAGRGERALDDLIGMFVNTVVLRTEVDAALPVRELLRQVRDRDLAALAHADVPFERVVEAMGRTRSSSYSPLFQVMLTFQNMPTGKVALPGVEVEVLEPELGETKFDLHLTGMERYDERGRVTGLRLRFAYATDIFDAATVRLLADRLLLVLRAIADDPATPVRAVDIRTAAERGIRPAPGRDIRTAAERDIRAAPERTRRASNTTAAMADSAAVGHAEFPAELPELVAAAAARTPDAIALAHGEHRITYHALDTKIAAVVHAMGAAAKPEAVVQVALAGLAPGIVAALGAGGLTEALHTLAGDARGLVLRSASPPAVASGLEAAARVTTHGPASAEIDGAGIDGAGIDGAEIDTEGNV